MAFPDELNMKVNVDFGPARKEALALAAIVRGLKKEIEDLERRADALEKRKVKKT